MAWTDFAHAVDAGVDDPATELTAVAFKRVLAAANEQLGPGFQQLYAGEAQLRIVPPSRLYVAVFVGQASSTAHGKQGLHPLRIAELRDCGPPVRLVFVEHRTVWSGWLLPEDGERGNPYWVLPATVSISEDPGRLRRGWNANVDQDASDLERTTEVVFPTAVPPASPALTLLG